MKIYFAGSVRGGRDDKDLYLEIINILKNHGEVLTEHIGDARLTDFGEVNVTDDYIYERDMVWLKLADVVVAEVTTPSLGVGYEVAYAQTLGKKVLCLSREKENKRLSAMINGNKDLIVTPYKTINDLPEIFSKYLK